MLAACCAVVGCHALGARTELVLLVLVAVLLIGCPSANSQPAPGGAPHPVDLRSYQHGIDFVPLPEGRYYLIWSSAGNPPLRIGRRGGWTHDIYYSVFDPAAPRIDPIALISYPQAQEPSSAAISKDGHIMITMEDGWNTQESIAQRYGVYDASLKPVLPYPQMVFDGGHSGHVAAVGDRFVVFYGNEWVDGGGVDNLGSGDDVLAAVYSSTGRPEAMIDVAVGPATRDWWPILAGAESRACLVWQRFVDGETYADLMVVMLDPAAGALVGEPVTLQTEVKYYTYSVEYIPSVDRFLILGAFHAGGGFGYLLDENGKVTGYNGALPPIIRESQSAVRDADRSALVAHITAPTGLMVLSVTGTEITLVKAIPDDYAWQYGGTDGIFLDANRVFIASLSSGGLVAKVFDIR